VDVIRHFFLNLCYKTYTVEEFGQGSYMALSERSLLMRHCSYKKGRKSGS